MAIIFYLTYNMKKILVLILSFFCMLSFVSCEKENKPDTPDTPDTFESNMRRMYGDYKLSDIHWPGLPVDLNNDDIGYWDCMNSRTKSATMNQIT